jgi:hypothetical protein
MTGGHDPLAAYHDRLNAAVVEALQGVTEQVGELRKEWAIRAEGMASYQRVTMQHSERIVALEADVRKVERQANEIATVAKQGAARRRTDTWAYLLVQGAIGVSLAAALAAVAIALWRIAGLVEVLAR